MNYIKEVIKNFSKNEKDTGSPEVQIALSSYRIGVLSRHLKMFKQDHQAKRNLLFCVNQRKKLAKYLRKKNPQKINKIMKKLNMKKI